jgi:non-specific serine/threonine protein kinase
MDWSYLLLTDTQQRVFERLSVFASGWRLDAAEVVCAGHGVAAEDVLEALLQLIRKSLVTRIDVSHGRARYGLLETLRQYASDKLLERDRDEPAARERHAAYYSGLIGKLDPASSTTLLPFAGETVTAPVFEILDDGHDNVQVALKWWLDTRRATEAVEFVRALTPLWMWRGIPAEGRKWVQAALDLAANTGVVPLALHAQALMFGGIVAQMQADPINARTYLEASLAVWQKLGDQLGLTMTLARLGNEWATRGEFDQADATLSEALAMARHSGDAFTQCGVLLAVSELSICQNRCEDAAAYSREFLAIARTVERASYRTYATTAALVLLGRAESKLYDSATAMSLFREALALMRDSGLAGYWLGHCLDWVAADLDRLGNPQRAARVFGAADAHWRTIGVARSFPLSDLDHELEVQAVQAELGQDAFVAAWNEGRTMNLADVFRLALDEAD